MMTLMLQKECRRFVAFVIAMPFSLVAEVYSRVYAGVLTDVPAAALQVRLENLRQRLAIDTPQQATWQQVASGVVAFSRLEQEPLSSAADASSIARVRAEPAMERACRMIQIADAVSNTQALRRPDQQQHLNAFARYHWQPHQLYRLTS